MKFEYPRASMTLEFDVSNEIIDHIKQMFREFGNMISFVGGPLDGFGMVARGDLPRMLLLDGAGLQVLYKRVDCDYWIAYEFMTSWEAP